MSTFEPTLFTLETNTPLNDEQIAAQLTANRLGCFEDGDQSHEHAKRMLIYRFKQFFVHSRNTAYNEVVPFSIDWNDYIVLNNTPVKAQNKVGKSCFIHDVDAFLANVPIFRAEWSVNATHDDVLKALSMKNTLQVIKMLKLVRMLEPFLQLLRIHPV